MAYKEMIIRIVIALLLVGSGALCGYFLSELAPVEDGDYFPVKAYISHMDGADKEQFFVHSELQKIPMVSENIHENSQRGKLVRKRHRLFVTVSKSNDTIFEDFYEMDVNGRCVLSHTHKVYKLLDQKYALFCEYIDQNGDGVYEDANHK